jgi:hypothetical protein
MPLLEELVRKDDGGEAKENDILDGLMEMATKGGIIIMFDAI